MAVPMFPATSTTHEGAETHSRSPRVNQNNLPRRGRMTRRAVLKAATVVFATWALSIGTASAQTSAAKFPDRPIRVVVGVPPGGSTDLVARIVGEQLGRQLGQPVVVENRGGAAGNIGAERVAK